MAVAGISTTSLSSADTQDQIRHPRELQTGDTTGEPGSGPLDSVTLHDQQKDHHPSASPESDDPVLQAFYRLLRSTQADRTEKPAPPHPEESSPAATVTLRHPSAAPLPQPITPATVEAHLIAAAFS